ncbi:hypothetical protein ABPG75_005093 [Micractinium tetrahymenae]
MSPAAPSNGGPAVRLQPAAGQAEAKQHPREFALLAQASDKGIADGGLTSVPKQALQGLVKQDGVEELPGELPFDKLAVSLRRGCTHAQAAGSGDCLGFAAHDASGKLTPFRFERRELQPGDVRLQVAYCGICHSDLHKVRSEWGPTNYPVVPGHEIVGIVTEVGSAVEGFRPGDRAAVGCMVGSCGRCAECGRGLEQYCAGDCGVVWTYDSKDPAEGEAITRGGYSTHLVVNEKFVLHLPANLPMDAAAPLLCAGITTYSPLRHFGLDKPGTRVGVVGLGGLGHMAVKLAKAFGCEVTVISTSPGKKEEACSRLGADHFLVSKDEAAMAAAAGTLDGIIDTVSAPHELATYLNLLDTDGRLVMVGLSPEALPLPPFAVAARRRVVAGSSVGGIKETQEMLDFCGEHSITCDIEKISVDYVNTAMERLERGDVFYRFVIDVQGSLVA